MFFSVKSAILKASRDGRILCPFCGKSLRIRETAETDVTDLGVFCRSCHQEIYITIKAGQRFYSQRPVD